MLERFALRMETRLRLFRGEEGGQLIALLRLQWLVGLILTSRLPLEFPIPKPHIISNIEIKITMRPCS